MTYLADTVTLTGTQTLTNKTITSAAFSGTHTGNFTTTGQITIDSAGQVDLNIDKGSAAVTGGINFKEAGIQHWRFYEDTDDALAVARYNGSGTFQDVPLAITNSTGNVTIAKDLEVNGTFTVGISDIANARLYVSDGSVVGRAINITSSDGNGAAIIGTSGGATTTNGLVINAYRGAGFIALQTVSTTRLSIASTGDVTMANDLTVNGRVKTTATTVGSLPSASSAGAGARSFVTDANATTFASVVAGGGANGVPVYSDGTNWRIG